MLQIVYYLLFAINLLYVFHFAFPFIMGLFKKKKSTIISQKFCQFAVLIPARNEECVIQNLIISLQKQNYPQENYDIYILINHCTDSTKQIALQNNVKIIECPDTVKSKGDVLSFSFEQLESKKIDAYLIFDADNVVHSDFLKEMNLSYQAGYQVAQGFRDSKNWKDNWLSQGYSIFYFIQNAFFQTRKNCNISAVLSGTGFMVRKEVIDQLGYSMTTMTEDLEFSAFAAVHNIKIDFVKEAITYDEQPTNFSVSWKQRKRWTTGAYQCFLKYWKELFHKSTNIISRLDLFYIFFSPFLQVLTCSIGFINMVYMLLKYNCINSLFQGILMAFLAYSAVCLFASFIVKYNGKNPNHWKLGILTFPIFLITWIPIQFICLLKRVEKWEPIEHKASVKVEEI